MKPVLTPQGWELLNSLPDYDDDAAAQLNMRLRRDGWPAETVAAALTQARLRRQARRKFGDFAGRMLFTHEGLQQSTRLPVAARHALRFRRAGLEHVADLGCGLGADALAFASMGLPVSAVEADETTAAAATMNLLPFPEAEVLHTTAEDFAAQHGLLCEPDSAAQAPENDSAFAQNSGLWLDPARRDARSRIWDPEQFSPPLSFVLALAQTGIPLGVKLGPGIPHELVPEACEAEWVSIDGELVEVVLWFNALARPGVRRAATVLTSDGDTVNVSELSSGTEFDDGVTPPAAGRAGLHGILWEPDPAVIRAGLVAELCQQHSGRMLDEHIAYFCNDDDKPTPLARGYRVLEVLDFSTKNLKRWCAQQQVTSVEIKKRGVDVVPEQLRQQILPKKPSKAPKNHATLVITRLGQDRVAAVVRPL